MGVTLVKRVLRGIYVENYRLTQKIENYKFNTVSLKSGSRSRNQEDEGKPPWLSPLFVHNAFQAKGVTCTRSQKICRSFLSFSCASCANRGLYHRRQRRRKLSLVQAPKLELSLCCIAPAALWLHRREVFRRWIWMRLRKPPSKFFLLFIYLLSMCLL